MFWGVKYLMNSVWMSICNFTQSKMWCCNQQKGGVLRQRCMPHLPAMSFAMLSFSFSPCIFFTNWLLVPILFSRHRLVGGEPSEFPLDSSWFNCGLALSPCSQDLSSSSLDCCSLHCCSLMSSDVSLPTFLNGREGMESTWFCSSGFGVQHVNSCSFWSMAGTCTTAQYQMCDALSHCLLQCGKYFNVIYVVQHR